MHIAYIHQYFATPRGSTGTRSYEFARRWVAAGHRVTVLTSTAQLTPTDVPRGDLSRRSEFTIDGIRVIALPVAYSQKMSSLARISAFVRFMLRATRTLLTLPDLDVVFATSTPLTVAVPALVRRRLRGTPFIFEVRDLWPAVPHELGYLRNGALMWALRRFERHIYRRAAGVVALSPGMRDGVLAAAGSRCEVIVAPNCCDTDRFCPGVDGQAVRRERGWEHQFVCIHVGAMGHANGLDQVVRVADRLRGGPAVHFVLVGDGRERPALADLVRQLKLTNIEFTGSIPKEQLPGVFAAADVALVVFAPYPILEHNSANKFFDALSAGKPVALNYSGWQRELVESAGAGMGCRQGDEAQFAENIRWFRDHPAERTEMGRKARALAESRLSRDRIAAEVLAFITMQGRPA